MLTEECHLNPYLEAHGIGVVDTDLGERIVQLGSEAPSHIVMPAIHKRKEEVGALFAEHFGTSPDEDDPGALADAARGPLRAALFGADAALTGVNFAIAETGGDRGLHQRGERRSRRASGAAAHRLAWGSRS